MEERKKRSSMNPGFADLPFGKLVDEIFYHHTRELEKGVSEILNCIVSKYIHDEKSLVKFEGQVEFVVRDIVELLNERDYGSLLHEYGISPESLRFFSRGSGL